MSQKKVKKEMKIRSPKNGYNFEAKQKYREDVWKFFKKNLKSISKSNVLFFPSKEGLEIPLALSLGFKQENLIAIDGNPAVIAASKWRKEYPGVKFYGGKLSNVIDRIKKDGIKINAANLDFCNNLSHELIEEFNSFVCGDILSEQCFISLTVMNGRENKATNVLADLFIDQMMKKNRKYFSMENKRLFVVFISALSKLRSLYRLNSHDGYFLKFHKENQYMSGNIKMSYGLIEMASGKYISKILEKDYRKNIESKERYLVKKGHEFRDFLNKVDLSSVENCSRDHYECVCLYNTIINNILSDHRDISGARKNQRKIKDSYNFPSWEDICLYNDGNMPRDLNDIVTDNFLNGYKKMRNLAYSVLNDNETKNIRNYVKKIGCYNFN